MLSKIVIKYKDTRTTPENAHLAIRLIYKEGSITSNEEMCSQSDILARQSWRPCSPSLVVPPKGNSKEEDAAKSAKKDKDPVDKARDKARKKKRSQGNVQDKLSNLVLFDKGTCGHSVPMTSP